MLKNVGSSTPIFGKNNPLPLHNKLIQLPTLLKPRPIILGAIHRHQQPPPLGNKTSPRPIRHARLARFPSFLQQPISILPYNLPR